MRRVNWRSGQRAAVAFPHTLDPTAGDGLSRAASHRPPSDVHTRSRHRDRDEPQVRPELHGSVLGRECRSRIQWHSSSTKHCAERRRPAALAGSRPRSLRACHFVRFPNVQLIANDGDPRQLKVAGCPPWPRPWKRQRPMRTDVSQRRSYVQHAALENGEFSRREEDVHQELLARPVVNAGLYCTQ